MARFGSLATQYLDGNGNPYSGGKVYFYESGTTTLKTTYSDADESIANTNPVVLDADGRLGDVFFSGSAKVVLTDSADVQIDVADPITNGISGGSFSAYSALVTYDNLDFVEGPDNLLYQSIAASNLGNTPASSPTKWQEVKIFAQWNTNHTYNVDDLVIGSDNELYRCINGSSQGDDPTSTPAEWALVIGSSLPRTSDVVVDATTSRTLATGDNGDDLIFTSGSGVTVTVDGALAVGFQCSITRAGSGTLTITSSDNLNGGSSDLAINAQWSTVWLMQYSEGNWLVSGDAS